jgi:hypothetical protein
VYIAAVPKKKRKKAPGGSLDAKPPARVEEPERAWRNAVVPRVLTAIALIYFAAIWLDTAGSTLPSKVLPRTFLYFTTVACLFPHAAAAVIDYRAEGWMCASHKWAEIETATDFPIDADNKENRFYRALHFFKGQRLPSQALDEYLVTRHNARAPKEERIGGVRLLSLRAPLPEPGKPVAPYTRKPLDSYPADQRKNWYWTPSSKRAERCGDKFDKERPEP